MATIDLSRSATEFSKHYKSVRAQQGRVLLDDDYNENERIHGEDVRRSRVDIIGPAGTPDSGFLVSNARVTGGHIDFDIAAGTFYLGGLHLELEQTERFQVQSDWLQFSGASLPTPPSAGRRFDLVYLESWLQPVSAIEDGELLEVALGGADTTTRIRDMRRVRLATGVATGDCRQDWRTLVNGWTANHQGTLNGQNELVPDTKLQVGFDPGSSPDDLCSPPVAGGYLGAENQAIRVQLTDATHFTWGFDNAAPLYRVQVGNNSAGQKRVITMMTTPKDQAHWPMSGQVVELLPWSAVLSNGEKLAERKGFLARVDASYDPDTNVFTLVANVPPGFGNGWNTRPDQAQLGANEFLYMRVWNRGLDVTSPLEIPITPAVSLGQTGLNVTFTGADRLEADHWIIAARPQSPNLVVPWVLELGRRPHGYRRFLTPLAVIEWQVNAGEARGKVIHDCRETFPPLTRLHSCCTYTVGDGTHSFGTFNRIQEAIDHLPAEGGEVCILPGLYEENIHIRERRNITVHGCGGRTILAPLKTNQPAVHIRGSQQIKIRNLAIHAPRVIGLSLTNFFTGQQLSRELKWIELTELDVIARDESAIDCRGGQFIEITRNNILVQNLADRFSGKSNAGKSAAVFVAADDVKIELNRIETEMSRRAVSALGGLQIGGGSERVEIRRNRITRGNGNGITLGSFTYIRGKNINILLTHYTNAFVDRVKAYPGGHLFLGDDDCLHPDPDPKNPKDPDDPRHPLTPVSDGNLSEIRIIDNDINQMGLNGIATYRLSRQAPGWPILITLLEIEANRIINCMQIGLGKTPFSVNFPYGYGGISLLGCEYLIVRRNRIENCGESSVDPICGVFVSRGLGLLFEQNEIVDNGPLTSTRSVPTPGPRGGIVIEYAAAPKAISSTKIDAVGRLPVGYSRAGFPALRVTDNIVSSPLGPALQVIACGLVDVADNQLTTQGVELLRDAAPATPLEGFAELGGATVRIVNVGIAYDAASQVTGFQTFQNLILGANKQSVAGTAGILHEGGIVGGQILFNDNQVLLTVPESRDETPIISSVLLLSLDDVSKEGNQCECRVGARPLRRNGMVMSVSARVADNRYTETPARDRNLTDVSAFTFALMNSTTDNQGTRCFMIIGHPNLTVDEPNRSLVELSGKGFCRKFNRSWNDFFREKDKTTAVADNGLQTAIRYRNEEHVLQAYSLELERARVDVKYGADSQQAKDASTQVLLHDQMTAGLKIQTERLDMPTPEPAEDSFVVYGRVMDSEGNGLSDLAVSVVDQRSNELAKKKTDDRGVFELVIHDVTGKTAEQESGLVEQIDVKDKAIELLLRVLDSRGRELFRDHEPFAITPGSASYREVVTTRGHKSA